MTDPLENLRDVEVCPTCGNQYGPPCPICGPPDEDEDDAAK